MRMSIRLTGSTLLSVFILSGVASGGEPNQPGPASRSHKGEVGVAYVVSGSELLQNISHIHDHVCMDTFCNAGSFPFLQLPAVNAHHRQTVPMSKRMAEIRVTLPEDVKAWVSIDDVEYPPEGRVRIFRTSFRNYTSKQYRISARYREGDEWIHLETNYSGSASSQDDIIIVLDRGNSVPVSFEKKKEKSARQRTQNAATTEATGPIVQIESTTNAGGRIRIILPIKVDERQALGHIEQPSIDVKDKRSGESLMMPAESGWEADKPMDPEGGATGNSGAYVIILWFDFVGIPPEAISITGVIPVTFKGENLSVSIPVDHPEIPVGQKPAKSTE